MKHTIKYTYFLLLFISLLNGLCFYGPVALLVRTQNGISVSQFFIIQMILSISIFVSEIPAGFLSDKIGYKKTLVLSQMCLLLARILLLLSKNFWLFALEAVVEALSISLSSGTESAYVYSFCKGEEFALRSSRIARAGTVGYLISTVSYSLILPLFDIKGLVFATCITTCLSLLATLLLPVEQQTEASENTGSQKQFLPSSSNAFFLLFSAISISYLVFNFFCAVKVERIGFSYESLSLIILSYSALELLAPMIIRHIREYSKALSIVLGTAAAGFFALYRIDNAGAIVFMLFLPLLLSVLSTLSSKLINESIDRYGLGDQRASILSVFNIGNSLLEIVFLAASAALTNSDGNTAFLFVAVYTSLVFLVFVFKSKRA